MGIDPSAYIAPTARIAPEAVIGPNCHIGEYCVIERDVTLGPGCRLEPYVYLKRWTELGAENEISAGAVLGTDPFDKAFTGERSYLRIGHRNRIREHWTISRGTKPGAATVIGNDNYIMGSGHIAHDCRIGNDCVIASNTLVAGYAEIGDQAFISGGVVIHQYSKIGRLVMVAGNSRVNLDLPPFFLYHGFDARPVRLNLVGLRRAGFTANDLAELRADWKTLYRSGLRLPDAAARLRNAELAAFVLASKRGIARPLIAGEQDRGRGVAGLDPE
jgi:UDP-N-acetylglucosamine acyltransferase